MLKGLRTVIYPVADRDAAVDWYSKVLGIEPYFNEPYYVGFDVGGYELGLDPNGGSPAAEGATSYWGVDDAVEAQTRLIELGATLETKTRDVGDGILVGTVRDPFGNLLGVIQNPNFKLAG